ncbi:MAG: hypothetical protein M3220_19025 [Chloroflexota bacterium]|nr:hypothetical protein [Chloroflexota bacterium]
MKTRVVRVMVVLAVVVVALLLFTIPVTLAAPFHSATSTGLAVDSNDTEGVIHARRKISIPFGIEESATLEDARTIEVSGHGECPPEGESFKVRVTDVTQDEARAKSQYTEEIECTGGKQTWSVKAQAQGPGEFERGSAQVCAMVLVFTEKDGTLVRKWCKEVELE